MRGGAATGFGFLSLLLGIGGWLVCLDASKGERGIGYVLLALGLVVGYLGMRRGSDTRSSQLLAVAGMTLCGLGIVVTFLDEQVV